MTTVVEAAFVDTNVLIDVTDEARPRHLQALALLERHPSLFTSAQVAREYLVVCTRPVDVNGLGLPLDDALDNLAELRRAVGLLPEEKPVLPELLALLRETRCAGKAIHDASVVASVLAHGLKRLVTSSPRDFERFGSVVQVDTLEGSLEALDALP